MTIAKSKTVKILSISGSSLLLIMALLHGSGLVYVSSAIAESNAEDFLKDIVPVLFAHPSIHLIGLAAFGILTLFLSHEGKKVLWLLAVPVIIDAALAFYLGGIVPGILLTIAALCFFCAGFVKKQV